MIVFDVGANKGEFSEHVLKNHGTVQVFAYEPNSKICRESLESLQSKYPNRFQVTYVALSRENGAGRLYGSNLMNGQLGSLVPLNVNSEGWNLHTSFLNDEGLTLESEVIDLLAVSDLVQLLPEIDIDFIKIDTQGTDVLILTEFLKYFKIKSGVVEVDVGHFAEGSRYETSSNKIENLVKILIESNYLVTKLLPNNSHSDEFNVFFSRSFEEFDETAAGLKLSSNPTLARYWNVQGIGTSEDENNQLLLWRFLRKVLRAFNHPKSSFRSVLLKLTK
jgi:FkbM family methyltransferase